MGVYTIAAFDLDRSRVSLNKNMGPELFQYSRTGRKVEFPQSCGTWLSSGNSPGPRVILVQGGCIWDSQSSLPSLPREHKKSLVLYALSHDLSIKLRYEANIGQTLYMIGRDQERESNTRIYGQSICVGPAISENKAVIVWSSGCFWKVGYELPLWAKLPTDKDLEKLIPVLIQLRTNDSRLDLRSRTVREKLRFLL